LKNIILFLLFIMLPAVAHAESTDVDRPHWSLEFKGGNFTPAIPGWAASYGDRSTGQLEGGLAYKILRQVDAGVSVGRIRDGGQGFAPVHGTTGGHINYQLFPVNVFLVLRGVFNENQWVVPYVGGGWTRMYYQEEFSQQSTIKGHTDGSHVRGGLQFLLDALDPSASNSMFKDYGIYHSYLFIEGQNTKALINDLSGKSIDLGGTSILGGVLFEF
jgi:hypothetical protein